MLIDYLKENSISIYYLSKQTNISYCTLNYIANGKINIANTALINAIKIADSLNISVEELYNICLPYSNQDFENFKSNVCHELKSKGSINFLIDIMSSTIIEDKWKLCRKEESLYLLSMVDYLSRLENIPLCTKYKDYRGYKIEPTLYPLSYIMSGSKKKLNSIPEFEYHGIIEGEVFDVC